MKIRITVLCDNLVCRLAGSGEHGFSAFIEMDNGNYLFDTGIGHSIVANSFVFGKDLRTVRKIFLSHGHYDHTGGLPEVLRLRGKVNVYAHPHVFLDRIAVLKKKTKETKRFVGIPFKKGYLESLGADFIFNTKFIEVEKGIFLTGEVPRKTPFEKPDPRLFTEVNGKITQDILLDDQSLILDSKKGLILILGCAHSGMINIINHVINKTKGKKFYAILGGTHLDFLTPEQLEESIKSLRKIEVEKIGVSHCTGMRAAFRLHQEFGDRFFYGCVGSVLEV
ncbi:MAG: MBL fold metallo-hydrolase [Nitrospirae bacterium]|jgi:7,8-dihydropterin-6-yl-methyl-4-(beta-D-ribofuranosyl)aminobenzene 5'-phosphate synthase|nr:MBL fold metallo-hydrolase [Nitrospirota bacterium]